MHTTPHSEPGTAPVDQTLSRKQFLAMVGSLIGTFILSQFWFTSKESYVRADTYGNNVYGGSRKV